MIIRDANKGDVKAIYEIIQNNLLFVNSLDYPKHVIDFMSDYYSESNIEKWIKEFTMFLVAEEDNKVIGSVALDKNEIKGLYVGTSNQRKGVGRKLINELEFRSVGKKVILYASLTAYDFYKYLGYNTVERDDDPNMGVAYLMEKEL